MTRWIPRVTAAAVLFFGLSITGHGQATSDASKDPLAPLTELGQRAGLQSLMKGDLEQELGAKLRQRYDLVALQQGIALVPRQAGSNVRLVQIEGGVVSVDGQTLTGAQLRERLGADADLVVQASYLTPEQQRALAGAAGSPAPPPAAAPTAPPIRTEVRRDDVFRFGGDLTIDVNERIEGDAILFGGAATVDGEVTGDVFAFGGPVRLGPQAIVRGDVIAVGGALDRAPGAQVLGEVHEVGGGRGGAHIGPRGMMSGMFGPFGSRVGSLAATILRLTLVLLVGLVVVAFGRGSVERVAARTAVTPVRSGVIGLLAQILFVPVLVLTCVVLVVSIVGIPLLALVPFAILLLVLVMLVGFVGLAYHVGRLLAVRLRGAEPGPYASFAIGAAAIGAVTLVAKLGALVGGFLLAPLTAIGYLVEYVAWTVGFGAALLYWYETQSRLGGRRPTAPAAPAPTPGEA